LTLDCKDPSITVEEYAYNETRYRQLLQSDEPRAELLMKEAKQDVVRRWNYYRQMAAMEYKPEDK
jgi:pyruvate-ferredoxin/flavodoxin oxidoreductase